VRLSEEQKALVQFQEVVQELYMSHATVILTFILIIWVCIIYRNNKNDKE